MSCFWDSLVAACNHHNLLLSRRTNLELCRELISLNKLTKSVTVNDEPLSKQCMNENFQAVKNYDVNGINSGHLTGTHDYFLCLIAELTHCCICSASDLPGFKRVSRVIRLRGSRTSVPAVNIAGLSAAQFYTGS